MLEEIVRLNERKREDYEFVLPTGAYRGMWNFAVA